MAIATALMTARAVQKQVGTKASIIYSLIMASLVAYMMTYIPTIPILNWDIIDPVGKANIRFWFYVFWWFMTQIAIFYFYKWCYKAIINVVMPFFKTHLHTIPSKIQYMLYKEYPR